MSIFHGAGWSEGTSRQADAGDRQGDSSLSDDPMGQLGIAPAIVTGKPPAPEPARLAPAQPRRRDGNAQPRAVPLPAAGSWAGRAKAGKRARRGPARERAEPPAPLQAWHPARAFCPPGGSATGSAQGAEERPGLRAAQRPGPASLRRLHRVDGHSILPSPQHFHFLP